MWSNNVLLPQLLLSVCYVTWIGANIADFDYTGEDDDAADYFNITSTIDSILKTYDIRLRPNFGGSPVTVEMDMDITSINSISEVNMDYTITMYFRQYWKDERLAYDPRLGNISFDGQVADRIWVPDTYFVNDKHAFIHDVTVSNRMIRFHFDGSVLYGLRITTVLSCMMDLHDYPLDVQNCTLEIESYGYTTKDINYEWHYGNRSVQGLDDVELPQFVLEKYTLVKRQIAFSTGSYPRLALEFILKRSVGFFILQTYLPCILIVMLSWVSFWINHEATSARVALVAANKQVETARTTIGITTVLTMTTISTSVRASLPRISYIKAIDIYLVTSFAFVFAALLEYAIVNYNFWQSQKKITKENNIAPPPPPTTCQHKIPNSIYEQSNRTVALRLSQLEDERSGSPEHAVEEGIPECTNMRTYNSSNRNAVKHRRRLSFDSRRCSAPELRHRKGFVYSVRRKASSIKVKIPRVHDVNIIDKYSRLIFPLTFTIFNLFYWCLYLV